MLQLPRSWPYCQPFFPLPMLVADFSAGVRRRSANQPSMPAIFADSGTVFGDNCLDNQDSGVPAVRSRVRAPCVKPVPKRFRWSLSRDVVAGALDAPVELLGVVAVGDGVVGAAFGVGA